VIGILVFNQHNVVVVPSDVSNTIITGHATNTAVTRTLVLLTVRLLAHL
jgi:hypothetical protein